MKNNVRVEIIETGEVFDSITACANYIGGNARHASIVSRNPRMTCKGYHIVRIDEPFHSILLRFVQSHLPIHFLCSLN